MRFLFVLLLFLSSCSSFSPLYGAEYNTGAKIESVEIEEIDSIIGSEIYFQLSKLIGGGRDTKYSLKIIPLSDNTHPLAISGESELVKQNVEQHYSYILTDKDTGKELDSGKIRMLGSYNVMDSSFQSYTNEKFTKKNIARNIAEEIHMRLRLYFASN